ncbi:beta-mannanase [Paenibacillus macerans]|uniref:beta-mannanase n=1 Tax=Paenibacillus macerans TaxID=44252 RepID=UPI002DBF3D6D|nr:beta-mannanase [Paenibacillus macerans]MEC0328998.1 beta-mannanase [Paenibacillus macerans]
MRFVEAEEGLPLITQLSYKIDEDRCKLQWQWPEGIQAVYIDKRSAERERQGEYRNPPSAAGLKLYTREEYKTAGGYADRIDTIGLVAYTVYACIMDDGDKRLVYQPDGRNTVEFSTGRAKIRYSVSHKSGLLRKYKTVQISVLAEVEIPKEALCYVKKQGSYPVSIDDGTVYPFLRDFPPGRSTLPPIEVGKNDYVRLFFTDGPKYGRLYELIPE